MCFMIFWNEKNTFLGSKNKKFKKVEKLSFFQNVVQNWLFFHLLFFGNIGQENVFYDILERKNAFLGYKNKKFKKSNNSHFSKGDTLCCVAYKRQVIKMRKFDMFITSVCVLFLVKLRWPKNKSLYDTLPIVLEIFNFFFLSFF